MGSQESKNEGPFERDVEPEDPLYGSSTTPVHISPLDPRSPSALFARTPIDSLIAGNKVEPTEQPHAVILGVDPRSPTMDFERTPIVVDMTSKKLRNKNFDNVLKSTMQTPVLEVQNKRRSLVGLLETNLDFTETNLDEVILNKSRLSTTPKRSTKLVTEEAVHETPETNKVAEKVEEVSDTEEISEEETGEAAKEILEVVKETDEAVKKNNEEPKETSEVLKEALEDKHFDDTINITVLSKNFDMKLTNLIYEDNVECLSPKMEIHAGNRTPLGTRNANSEPRKHLQRLRVSDKPRKSEGLSRIPVFKKVGVQCENTPPRKMDIGGGKRAGHLTKWDADKTLII